MLYAAVEKAPSAEVVDEEDVQRYFAGFDEHFLHYCDKELKKIDTFFSGEGGGALSQQVDSSQARLDRCNSSPELK